MSESEAPKTTHRKWARLALLIIPVFFGLQNFISVSESPRFKTYRTLDVVRLTLSGACFGAALIGSIAMLVRPRP